MNVRAHRALLADHERSRRARVRQALLGELPGLEVEEAGDPEALVRSLEDRHFDMTIVRHPFPSGEDLPVVLKTRWPELALLLYAPLESESALAEALEDAGDAYFLESDTELPGLRAALRLALSRVRPSALSAEGERRSLESLSRRLVELQEAERRALARELHDEVGQILASFQLHLEGAKISVPQEVRSLLGRLSSRVRDLSMDLRPPMLDELGLLPTLLWHFERYRAQTGVRVDFQHSGPVGRLATNVETAAFRIVQEALTNVARHARVQEARVSLEAHPDRIELRVEDRGVGFRPESAWTGASSGLAGMRERARLVGGRFRIDSAPGTGTRLEARLPRAPFEGQAA